MPAVRAAALLLAAGSGAISAAVQPPTGVELFFCGYAEGSSSNRYLEIYNAGNTTADLSDFAFPNTANSPEQPGKYEYWNEFSENAMLGPGQVYVIAHPDAEDAILRKANMTNSYLSTGDDGFALVYGNKTNYVILDSIGTWHADPGWAWDACNVSRATKDHTLLRKPCVEMGNRGNWTRSAGTTAEDCEWIVLGQDNWTSLGHFDHNVGCSPAGGDDDGGEGEAPGNGSTPSEGGNDSTPSGGEVSSGAHRPRPGRCLPPAAAAAAAVAAAAARALLSST